MAYYEELFILSMLSGEGQAEEKIDRIYRHKAEEWTKEWDSWKKNYLFLSDGNSELEFKKLQSELLEPETFLNTYEGLTRYRQSVITYAKAAQQELENGVVPLNIHIVQRKIADKYQKYFEDLYYTFLYMVWIMGDQENESLRFYRGNNLKDQIQYIKEVILPYSSMWTRKRQKSYWLISQNSDSILGSYAYHSVSKKEISYYKDYPHVEGVGDHLWKIKEEYAMKCGNGNVLYFGVGKIHNLSPMAFKRGINNKDIVTEIQYKNLTFKPTGNGINMLEQWVRSQRQEYYCIEPESFTYFLNFLEMNQIAELRKANHLCPFCGRKISSIQKLICEKHGSLSTL